MSDFEDDTDYLASDSSEDDFEQILGVPRRKNENYLEETIPQYDNESFLMHFRIKREHVHTLADEYGRSHYYKKQAGQYGKISALHQMLIFLWYIGHQTASFRDVADGFDITISSLHRSISTVTVFTSNLSRHFIKWPSDHEKRDIEEYYREKGFPGIVGAIDGSHIEIDKPATDAESYINRKGYYSIQLQVICDHSAKIRDVFVGYPGSVHDARVLRNSPINNNLEEKCGRYFLIGDSAYPLSRNLLTPFKDRGQLTVRQRNYNKVLSSHRYIIEQCFGRLKQKFRQLYHIKLRRIDYIVHLIRAACVLHNISLNDELVIEENNGGEPLPAENLLQINEDEDDDENQDIDIDGRRFRDHIVNTLRIV